jgi:hypothetical protein
VAIDTMTVDRMMIGTTTIGMMSIDIPVAFWHIDVCIKRGLGPANQPRPGNGGKEMRLRERPGAKQTVFLNYLILNYLIRPL